ncbi:MAG: single-stranded DNA-binding protein, partial [Candidatus Acidiferrales bacterium]
MGASRKWGEKGDLKVMSYNSVSLIGFVGSDPEQRQARNNGAKFTVFSLATQRSWKNAEEGGSGQTAALPEAGPREILQP